MKKTYTRPEIEVTAYEVENVVTADVSAMFNAGDTFGGETISAAETINYTEIFGA